MSLEKKRVAIVGSGNWACAIAKIVGHNCKRLDAFETDIKMWVYEEFIEGRKLSEIINQDHENVKYMPGVKLPKNVIADPDIVSATKGAHALIFVLPHQFLDGLCEKITGNHAPDCVAISLIKGVNFDEHGMVLISDILRKGLRGMDISVLMGANIANEVAQGAFCETTIGYNIEENGHLFRDLFDDPLFHVSIISDVRGVEVCGAVKNVYALGAGFIEGLGLGDNSRAAFIRLALVEMKRFIQAHYHEVPDDTFLESCGVADLIVSCYGGRNRRCAAEFIRNGCKKRIDLSDFDEAWIQGTLTCQELVKSLREEGRMDDYPIIRSIHAVAFEGASVESFIASLSRNVVVKGKAMRTSFSDSFSGIAIRHCLEHNDEASQDSTAVSSGAIAAEGA